MTKYIHWRESHLELPEVVEAELFYQGCDYAIYKIVHGTELLEGAELYPYDPFSFMDMKHATEGIQKANEFVRAILSRNKDVYALSKKEDDNA